MTLVRRFWVLGLGIVLVAVGVILEQIAFRELFSPGAFAPGEALVGAPANEPLTSTTFAIQTSPWPVIFVAVGMVLIAGWVGYRVGRRRARRSTTGAG